MFTTQAMMRGLDELYRETIAIAAARRGSPAPH
jgi:hypothetical protein